MLNIQDEKVSKISFQTEFLRSWWPLFFLKTDQLKLSIKYVVFITAQLWIFKFDLDNSGLNSGIYYLIISDDSSIEMLKLVKQYAY